MIKSIDLFDLDIDYILTLPEVTDAKVRIDSQNEGSVYFSIPLTESLRESLYEKFDLDFSLIDSIPMRWIKGDTKPHIDRSVKSFDKTYLAYLTDSQGEFIIDGESYPITRGSGYVFSEGLSHETLGTGSEPRLLLGPMSEAGISVGGPYVISYPGGTTVYIRDNSGSFELSLDQTNWNNFYFPVDVSNSDTTSGLLIIEFTTDITFTNDFDYFTCKTSHIQFGSSSLKPDGTKTNITISGVGSPGYPGYPGLIRNGGELDNGFGRIYVYNLNVISSGSTLDASGGWIGHKYYGKNHDFDNYIVNCSSTGSIIESGGGIVGAYATENANTYYLYIIGCSSSGLIRNTSGGIVGENANRVKCEKCWSTGNMEQSSGGIFGRNAGSYNNGDCIAELCYSTGNMTSAEAGGIFGRLAGSPSTGTGTAKAEKCYSRALNIQITSGGIFGSDAGTGSGSVSAINCYSVGTYFLNEGIIGGSPGNTTTTNCYASNGIINWSNSAANSSLTGTPTLGSIVGTTWVETGTNTPYELNNMGYTPYTLTNILATSTPSLVQTYSTSVNAGDSTVSAIVSGQSYTILAVTGGNASSYGTISIKNSTGAVSTTSSTAPGTYTLYIRNTGSYNITTLTLTVIENPTPDVPICFPAGTPVLTDQGEIAIEKIDKNIHTIRGQQIVEIVKSVPTSECLVCIERSSLANNIPNRRTFITKDHRVLYGNKMLKAENLTHLFSNIYKIPYDGKPVYNVLLKEHSTMMINNLTVETMNPQHILAKIYSGNYTPEQRNFLINKFNKYSNQQRQKKNINMRKCLARF